MNIVYAMTHHVYEWILPSMRSLKDHNAGARVFILAEDDKLPFELPMPAEIINVTGQTYFPEGGPNYDTPFKYINLLKVRYPSYLPVDKVIHLDIDTIVCDDLTELYNTDLTGKWVGACNERMTGYRPFGDKYYNMGVAVINLKQMRKDGAEQELQDYLNEAERPYADQNAWNEIGAKYNKLTEIPNRWNESRVTGRTQHPGIIHYCGYPNWFTRFDLPGVGYLNQYRKG